MDHPLVTPSRPPPPQTDISTIEQQKENIQPLPGGRSASQLAALTSQSRSGLGAKLRMEHDTFTNRLMAIDHYDEEGNWDEGRDGFTLDEVKAWSEDPLGVHQDYVRFIISSYPAGASATSQLVPVLERSTRKLLPDSRYINDPRYLRLWILYAGNIDRPEEAYRFLFAKNVGDRLAMLYEEYANVLEAGGKRGQAQDVYELGIARRAAPLERLKKRYQSFQARMLVAPPLPDPLPDATPASTSSSSARAILAGSGVSSQSVASGKENGARAFAVFSDAGAAPKGDGQGHWDDFGTAKSRKKENDQEAAVWKGETLPQGAGLATPKGTRLAVFRDSDTPVTPAPHTDSTPGDVFRSVRGPSDAEVLRRNPWMNYGDDDLKLFASDPSMDNNPSNSSFEKASKSASTSSAPTSSSASKSRSSSSKSKSTTASKSKSSSSKSKPDAAPAEKREERPYCDLDLIYPKAGGEVCFEELRVLRNPRYMRAIADWENGWQWQKEWELELENDPRRSYKVDDDGRPLLYDETSGAPLWDFLPRPAATSATRSPSPPPTSADQLDLLSSSPLSSRAHAQSRQLFDSPTLLPDASAPLRVSPSPQVSHHNLARPPSPTMNTRQAQALVDDLFAKTLVFQGDDNRDDSDEEPETDDDDDESPAFAYERQSQQPSQFSQSTMGALSQESVDDAPFVPFSRISASQISDSSMMGSQLVPSSQQQPHQSQLTDLMEESEESSREISMERARRTGTRKMEDDYDGEGEDDVEPVKPAPMALFRDPSSTKTAFRPVTKRAPLTSKPFAGTASTPAVASRLFEVRKDDKLENLVVEEAEEDVEKEEDDDDEPAHRIRFNPYADLVDVMSPISERTNEYTTSTMTHSSLSASQKSRRESQFPITTPVVEEDENSSEAEPSTDDDEYDADRGFVVEVDREEDDSDRSSFRTRGGFSTDEEDDMVEQPAPGQQVPLALPLAEVNRLSLESSSVWRESTHKDGQFDAELSAVNTSVSSSNQDRSFDASQSNPLPEGFTITGNQSGMANSMVLAETATLSGPFDIPCDPYEPRHIEKVIDLASPHPLRLPEARDLGRTDANKLATLQKTAKKRGNSSRKSYDKTGVIEEPWPLELDGEAFAVCGKLGEGAFGAVFRVTTLPDSDASDYDPDADVKTVAVKVERPSNLWEFHILNQLHARLPTRLRSSVIQAQRLYAYRDESFLFLDVCDQGTLLDIVNKAADAGVAPPTGGVGGMEEVVAMFFVVELLRILEGFHSIGIIHGDLKIDNCLVRLDEPAEGPRSWLAAYDRAGGAGWEAKGLKIIDYGRSIDLTAYPPGQTFRASFETDQYDCFEMREGRPWTYEPDYFGLASIAYNVLFGRYIGTQTTNLEDGSRKHLIDQAFRRYHQAELWGRLFNALLNPHSVSPDGSLPITNELAQIRSDMEEWLTKNSEKGKSLKGFLRKIEAYSMAR